jgi:hypothetical protein
MKTLPTYAELQNRDLYTYHHSALARGYYSRKADPSVREYTGRFGVGYVADKPYTMSTTYHVIEYYISK